MNFNECIGKICPVCHEEIKQGERITICPSCEIPHHTSCWEANKGCSTFGCTQQGSFKEKPIKQESIIPVIRCKNCGAELKQFQERCHKCGAYQQEEPPKKSSEKVSSENSVANVFSTIAVIIWVLGGIAGFLSLFGLLIDSDLGGWLCLISISTFAGSFMAGLLWYGIGEIIRLLSSINATLINQNR